jgi:hypothetical protein
LDIKTTDLGKNIFDTERKKAANFDDFLGSESSYTNNSTKQITKFESEQNSLKNTENRKKNIDMVKKEFGALADLLNVKSTSENETFNIDLFVKKKNNKKSNLNNKPINEEDEYDENYIDIERDMDGVEKVKKMFDDFDVNENKNDDDLLDLMDMASSK